MTGQPTEHWSTAEQIRDARAALIARVDGWREPTAYGMALVPSGTECAPEHFAVVITTGHVLPSVVMALVCGHTAGTADYEFSRRELELAVEMLAPAEAYLEDEHPNLWTWRDRYLPALDVDPGARIVAVFVDDSMTDAAETAEVAAFRTALARATA